MTRSIDDIRRDWSDPTHCLRESDEADVRVLLEAVDAAEERARAAEASLSALVAEVRDLKQWMLHSDPLFSARSGTVAEERKACGRRLSNVLAKAEVTTAAHDLSACAAGGSRDVLREFAFRQVERELREHELTVSVGGNPEHFVIVWEGDHPTGLTLLQAVDQLEEERDA